MTLEKDKLIAQLKEDNKRLSEKSKKIDLKLSKTVFYKHGDHIAIGVIKEEVGNRVTVRQFYPDSTVIDVLSRAEIASWSHIDRAIRLQQAELVGLETHALNLAKEIAKVGSKFSSLEGLK